MQGQQNEIFIALDEHQGFKFGISDVASMWRDYC